jgi:type III pantothenate kinase
MEINLLVMDIGNTRAAVGAFLRGELVEVTRASLDRRGELQAALASGWKRFAGEPAAVVGATVNPLTTEMIEHLVEQVGGSDVLWVGKNIDLPIAVRTEQPGQTGVDRVLNIAAAHEQLGGACVVVDAGTALTVDVCNDAGEFLGGSIGPGAGMMLQSLHQRTAKLPVVELRVPAGAIGRTTEEAILQGVYHGIRGAVKELVEGYATELGHWPEVIATGGDAKVLFEGWELVHAIAPDLTLYGIALAYANHHLEHDGEA